MRVSVPAGSRKKALVLRVVGYAISIACIAVLAAYVDWNAFLAQLRHVDARLVGLAALLVFATYVFFTVRWRLLLSLEPALPWLQTATYLMLGYLGNLLLPMRAGDAARVLLVRNAYGRGGAHALGSVLIERLLDLTAVLAFGAAIGFVAVLPAPVLVALRIAAIAVVVALLLAAWVAASPDTAARRFESMMRPFGARVPRTLAHHVRQFGEALAIVYPRDRASATRLAAVVFLTACGWGCFGAAMVLCTAAFGVEPPIAAGLLMMSVTNLGSAIPSSPGSLGVYHALAVLALSAWPIGLDTALSVATVSHAVVIGVQFVLGMSALGAAPHWRRRPTPG
jgi:uncharacterized protein (TIRG00374 family)